MHMADFEGLRRSCLMGLPMWQMTALGAVVSTQQGCRGAAYYASGAPARVGKALALSNAGPSRSGMGIGTQIFGFGKAANWPTATAQPSR